MPGPTGFHRIVLPLMLLAFVCCGARAQSTFTFSLGGSGLYYDGTPVNWGTSVGATAKFNVLPYTLARMQFNVDRIQHEVDRSDFKGTQTSTFVNMGFGAEAAVGTRDFTAFLNLTPHGTIRTTSRILTQDDGSEKLWILNRFSVGVIVGFGFEAYVTNSIGFEMQTQYDVFNLDHSDVDPIARSIRASIGVQFYLGKNFAR